jgi:hypothetical protein
MKTSGKESLGLCELKRHIPWFDKECLGFLEEAGKNAVDKGSKPKQCRESEQCDK